MVVVIRGEFIDRLNKKKLTNLLILKNINKNY